VNHSNRAKQCGIPWVVFVGESELNSGVVELKNVEAANKEEVAQRADFVEELRRSLKR